MTFGQILDAAAKQADNAALLASFARNLIPRAYLDKEVAVKRRADGRAVGVFLGSVMVMEATLEELATYGQPVEHPSP